MTHSQAADVFNKDEPRVDWHNATLWNVRKKRDKAAVQIPEWEKLRAIASQIKAHSLSNLSSYLENFEKKASENGVTVHWAKNGEEHNRIVLEIIQKAGLNKNSQGKIPMVKSKSMLTEECHLNSHLENNYVDVIDTDLGERIIQLRKEPPSHIVAPAIHLMKEEVGETFHEHLGVPNIETIPEKLVEIARHHLREKFLAAEVALTGVNFAVAETGEFVVCTNEGNADMGANLAKVHIASMGLEKIIPKRKHLGVFLRLLARSATGQPLTIYTSHFKKPRQGQQMHIVIVDNGRSRQLGRPDFRNSLKCIRCGACMNTCPVYRRSGGHSYHSTVGGPIGSILAPNLDMKKNADLPFASTLCGSCSNVCPVKIDIHDQLYKWRQELVKSGYTPKVKSLSMQMMRFTLSHPGVFNFAGKMGKGVLKNAPFLINNFLNPWYKQREMPEVPQDSFTEWYIKNRTKE